MKPLQSLLSEAQVTWVLDGVSLGVGIEGFQAHINAHLFARRDVFDHTTCFDTELDIVAVSTTHHAYALDLLDGEGFNVLLFIADKT